MPICPTLYHLGTPYIASLAQPLPKETLQKSLVVVVPSWSMNLLSSLTVLASPLNLLNAPPQPFDLPLIYSPCTTSTVLLTRLLTPRNSLFSSTNMAHYILSLAATIPNEFVLVGDFNIHVDTPSDTFPSNFLNLLSSVNLVQHVNFPTHIKNHTLDL